MANQSSINEITGTIGELTYYKGKTGYKVKKKSSLTKAKIMTDPRMEGVRKNMSEFGNAGKAAKMLRQAVRPLLILASDTFSYARLVKVMKAIANTDTINDKGQRQATFGQLQLLKGFNFNDDAKLGSIFYAPYTSAINRVTGELTITIAPFVANTMLPPPQGATHFRIISSGCEVDFIKQEFTADNQSTAYQACDNALTVPLSITHNVTPNSALPLFQLMGVQFFEFVNNKYYPIKSRAHNCLGIIGVDQP